MKKIFAILAIFAFSTANAVAEPELPRKWVETDISKTMPSYPAPYPGGKIISVPAGGDLQSAIDAANPGDIVELQAGATYSGGLTLKNKSNQSEKWIVIRTSAHQNLPDEHTRINVSRDKNYLATITGAIRTEKYASYYRFIGIDFFAGSSMSMYMVFGINNGWDWNGLPDDHNASQPHHIIIDRSYLHGKIDEVSVIYFLVFNGKYLAIINSHMDNVWSNNGSPGISGWNGSGPFKVVNNYLEIITISLIFGGEGSDQNPGMPSDFEIRRNYFYKRPEWKERSLLRWGDPSYMNNKTIVEFKVGQRILMDGNIMQNQWESSDQRGFLLNIAPDKSDGVKDLTFTNNLMITGNNAAIIQSDRKPSVRVKLANNLAVDIGKNHGGDGSALFIGHNKRGAERSRDIIIDHNTILNTPRWGIAINPYNEPNGDEVVAENVVITNNFFLGRIHKQSVRLAGQQISHNIQWSPDMFVNYKIDGTGDYRLKNPSEHIGTDGKPIGADIDAILSATAGVREGTPGGNYTPACSDGDDNDGDGLTDFPDDPGCSDENDTSEIDPDTIPPTAPTGFTATVEWE